MKKIYLFLLGLAIVLSFAGCVQQTEGLSPPSEEPTYTLSPSESISFPSVALPVPTQTPSPPPAEEEGGYFDNALFVGDSIMEGITAEGSCYLKANSSQTKLLWVDWGDSGLNRLGVIDLENGEFTAFERAGMELRYNQAVFWLDDDRVVAMMDLHTGEESDPNRTDEYYLCVYEF